MPAKKSTAKTTSAKTTTAKKSTVRKTTAKKPTARKSPPKKTSARKTTAAKTKTVKASAKKVPAAKTMAVRPGDLIVLDSAQVGSPSREGEVLQIIQGQVSVSYRVRWTDGHQTLISPMSGSARIIKASTKA